MGAHDPLLGVVARETRLHEVIVLSTMVGGAIADEAEVHEHPLRSERSGQDHRTPTRLDKQPLQPISRQGAMPSTQL